MKNVILILTIVTAFITTTIGQTVNQITIIPSNPTPTDTIYVISDFSFYGNCSYGLVNSNTNLVGSIIYITPQYCGYGDTTLCNSIDTFKIEPLPNANYTISIDYHQSSVCPIGSFDDIIAQFDTSLVVGFALIICYPGQYFNIFPNPAINYIIIDFENYTTIAGYQLRITNLIGQNVFQSQLNQKQFYIDISAWNDKGIYFVEIFNDEKIYSKKIVVQ